MNNIRPFKILIIGDSNVGKTSILLQYTSDFFQELHIATIGVEFKLKEITLDNVVYKLNIWDTAGQERFRAITKSFFKAADGIVFVYDVTDKNTFNNMKNWVKDAESKTNNFKSVIVGNKIDLKDLRTVTIEEGQNFASKKKCPFFESSAKERINIDEIFITMLKEILKDQKGIIETFKIEEEKNINLNKSNSHNKKKNCC
jgi:Ras-related protein Rab-1A